MTLLPEGPGDPVLGVWLPTLPCFLPASPILVWIDARSQFMGIALPPTGLRSSLHPQSCFFCVQHAANATWQHRAAFQYIFRYMCHSDDHLILMTAET